VAELTQTALIDAESRAWLSDLRDPGPAREDAVRRLHALLLQAARFEVARRRPALLHLSSDELDGIAIEAADDALSSVLGGLDDFHGASRFSTWACKYALLEAAVKLRRRAWQARKLPPRLEGGALVFGALGSPDEDAEQGRLLEAVRLALRQALTPHQREVLVALALDGVPIDVLAERCGSTRGALYETLHGARHTLRDRLTAAGIAPPRLERLRR
jgi:RNA polymerase sigma-70 factor, ECF subfamily